MMETKDWVSALAGLVVMALGLLPILHNFGIGPDWFGYPGKMVTATIITWVIALAALFLIFDAIQELTNSNNIGWLTIILGILFLAVGGLQVLAMFNVGPGLFGITIPVMIYNVIMVVEGLFLIIAMWAMNL